MTKKTKEMYDWTKFALTKVMPKITRITNQAEFGYHGLTHTEQVVFFGIDYALSTNTNPLPVILACALHDCARINDKWDEEHGPNCEPIAREFLNEYDFGLSQDDKNKIIEAIKNHTIGINSTESIAACLWDADRTRLAWENFGPIVERFSTERGLEVARFNIQQQKEYIQNQKQMLQEIAAPSFLLMEEDVLKNANGLPIAYTQDVHSVGTDEKPIIAYHATPDDIAEFISKRYDGCIFFTPRLAYANGHHKGRGEEGKTDQIVFMGNSSIDRLIYQSYLTKKYGLKAGDYFGVLVSHISNLQTKRAVLSEKEIEKIIAIYDPRPEQKALNFICNKFKNKELHVKTIPSRQQPRVYKVELRGVFPDCVEKTFKEQKINVPMENICRFMKIDYPIKNQKDFLRQTVKAMEQFATLHQDREKAYLKKINNFLTHVDISDKTSDLQEQSRKPYVQMAKEMLENFVNNQSVDNLYRVVNGIGWERNCNYDYEKYPPLIDGMLSADGIINYEVYNPKAITIKARYTYNFEKDEIIKIDQVNSFGSLAPEPKKEPAKKEPQKKKTPKDLTPELLVKNIQKYL